MSDYMKKHMAIGEVTNAMLDEVIEHLQELRRTKTGDAVDSREDEEKARAAWEAVRHSIIHANMKLESIVNLLWFCVIEKKESRS